MESETTRFIAGNCSTNAIRSLETQQGCVCSVVISWKAVARQLRQATAEKIGDLDGFCPQIRQKIEGAIVLASGSAGHDDISVIAKQLVSAMFPFCRLVK
jgi:hypothetical protein